MANENHIATAEDFRQAAERRDGETERVVLPRLGKAVMMRHPAPMWFIFRGRLPQSLAVRAFPAAAGSSGSVAGSDGTSGNALEELAQLAGWIIALLEEVMVSPRVSMTPGPGEISPDLLDAEDVNFIIRWAYGEVGSGGADDLLPFRAEREPAAPGAGCGGMVVPAQ
jgi:hypothetical protein